MPQLKWENNYRNIRAAEQENLGGGSSKQVGPPFNLSAMQPRGWLSKIPESVFRRFFQLWFWFGRDTGWFIPFPYYFQATCISRATDLREVLSRNETFNVPYGLEMEQLIGGPNCLLGDDGSLHDRQKTLLLQVIRPADPDALRSRSRHYAGVLIENSDGTLNVMADLVTRVVAEVCAAYFGFEIPEPDAFAQWTMAMSGWLFADPGGDSAVRYQALNGAARVRAVIDEAIACSRARHARGDRGDLTLVDRLVNFPTAPTCPAPNDDEIRAMLLAMTVGQVPTITLAAGNMFEELRRRPARWDQARAAARNRDMDVLTTILFECGRLNPALSPGLWRYVAQDTAIGTGWRRKKLKQGSVLMVGIMSALRDGAVFKTPDAFRLDRAANGEPTDLMFGFDRHRCLGKYLATAEITEIFAALLAQDDLKPAKGKAGTMLKAGPFARSFVMTFTPNSYRGT